MTNARGSGLAVLLLLGCTATAGEVVATTPERPHYLVTGGGGASEVLTAPHVGATLCQPVSGTPVRLLREARHGPHRYAQVVVLDGECAGTKGFAPWDHLQREPPVPPGAG